MRFAAGAAPVAEKHRVVSASSLLKKHLYVLAEKDRNL
jgi:hypothetical protein